MWPTALPASVSLMPMQNSAFAARRDRQPPVPQRVGAEVLDRARRAVEDELGEDRARHVGAGELLEHDRGLDVAQAGAAPLLADRDAEQLGLAHARPTTPAGTPRSRRRGGPSARARARRRRGRAGAARPGPRCRRTGSCRGCSTIERSVARSARGLTRVSGRGYGGCSVRHVTGAGAAIDFFQAQPYDEWAEARRSECPVIANERVELRYGAPTYQITRYRDAEAVLRDGETFSSSINAEHIGQFMGDLILAMDGAEHRQYRNLVAKAFRASQLERWDDDARAPDDQPPARRRSRRSGGPISSRRHVEVSGAGDLRHRRACRSRTRAQFHAWAEQINTGPLNPEAGHAASRGDGRLPAAARRSAARGADR